VGKKAHLPNGEATKGLLPDLLPQLVTEAFSLDGGVQVLKVVLAFAWKEKALL
jgi:hypothetical protein